MFLKYYLNGKFLTMKTTFRKFLMRSAGTKFLKTLVFACFLGSPTIDFAQSSYNAYEATEAPVLDGMGSEAIWGAATWKSIDQVWLGTAPTSADFQGRYKICWKGTQVFILAEIVDNVLNDGHVDPLVQWYDDDCVEIFIDEDRSKGNHQCTYNAFAYHVAINGDVVDLGTDCNPHLYNSHVSSARTVSGTTYTWELAMTIYGSGYTDAGPNTATTLSNGKIAGFSLAYCDNDGSSLRENFMGSEVMPSGHNNDNYITADYFGTLNFMGPNPTLGIHENEAFVFPSNGHIEIASLKEGAEHTVSIFDSSGKCLSASTQNGTRYTSTKHFAPGVYTVVIETENRREIQKLVIF